jgi:acyl-coenzyme A synthetase/AMP-(fatty) acid ligase
MKLAHHIEHAFSKFRNKPALTHYSSSKSLQTLTYGQLEGKVKGATDFFLKNGLQRNDLVISYMGKSADSAVVILATILGGGVACSLNSRLKAHQVVDLSQHARSKYVILDRGTANQIDKSEEARAAAVQFVLYSESPRSFSYKTMNAFGDPDATASTKSTCTETAADLVLETSCREDRPGYCLFTSGSTGRQKGVLISRDDLLQRVITEAEDYEITDADRLLSLLPFSFDVGLNQFLSSILSGAHLVILNSWFPKDLISAIKNLRISGISAVPTIWNDMLCYPQYDSFNEDIKTLRYITVSGGDLPQIKLLQLRQYFKNVNIFKTYGQSETFRSSILKPRDYDRKMATVGQPVKGTRVFILDENDKLVPPNTEGKIVHFGAGTMLRYIGDASNQQGKIQDIPKSLRDIIAEGKVVYTGDRGMLDEDGFLYLMGREDGMIKTTGYRVYPREVENCILEHLAVKQCAVVGIPDVRKGQCMIAEVVPKNGLNKDELVRHIRDRLPPYMVPDAIHIVQSLPLSENGKILYAEIKGKYE